MSAAFMAAALAVLRDEKGAGEALKELDAIVNNISEKKQKKKALLSLLCGLCRLDVCDAGADAEGDADADKRAASLIEDLLTDHRFKWHISDFDDVQLMPLHAALESRRPRCFQTLYTSEAWEHRQQGAQRRQQSQDDAFGNHVLLLKLRDDGGDNALSVLWRVVARQAVDDPGDLPFGPKWWREEGGFGFVFQSLFEDARVDMTTLNPTNGWGHLHDLATALARPMVERGVGGLPDATVRGGGKGSGKGPARLGACGTPVGLCP